MITIDNKSMGNAVLMPEFYGIGIKKLQLKPNNNLATGSNEVVEVRRMVYRSTYDDYSESSIFSRDKNGSTFADTLSKK